MIEGLVLVILLVVLYLVVLVRQQLQLPETQKSILFGIEILLGLAFMFALGHKLINLALINNRHFAMGGAFDYDHIPF